MACWHVRSKWEEAEALVAQGEVDTAEMVLQNTLTMLVGKKQSGSHYGKAGGAAAGAVAGSLIFPGVGTLVGLVLGGMLGEKGGEKLAEGNARAFQAETFYRLGGIYEKRGQTAQARQFYMQVLGLEENHAPARSKLRELL